LGPLPLRTIPFGEETVFSPLRLTVTPPGEAPMDVPAWARPRHPLRILVPRRTEVAVTVLDDASGRPVAGAKLTVEAQRQWIETISALKEASAETDVRGTASIRTIPGPIDSLAVEAPGYRSSHLSATHDFGGAAIVAEGSDFVTPLAAGEVRRLVLRLRRGTTVTGRVLFVDRSPAVGARLFTNERFSLGGRSRATADADGRFRLDGVLPRRPSSHGEAVAVVAVLDGYAPSSVEPRLEAEPSAGATEDVGEIVLERTGCLRGRVTAADGAPVADAKVSVVHAAWSDAAVTDDEGRFAVATAGPEHEGWDLNLVVTAEGRVPLKKPIRKVPPPGTVVARA
jgi:hypothetical protein